MQLQALQPSDDGNEAPFGYDTSSNLHASSHVGLLHSHSRLSVHRQELQPSAPTNSDPTRSQG